MRSRGGNGKDIRADGPEQVTGPLRELVQLLPDLAVTLYETAPHARHDAAPSQLSSRQMRVVVHLAHRPKMTMSELAEGLGISRAAATELVARLEEKGVVRREHDSNDRRLVLVSLAARAEGLADELLAEWAGRLAATFTEFPAIDPAILAAFLRAFMRECRKSDAS